MKGLQDQRGYALISGELGVERLTFFAGLPCRGLDAEIGSISFTQIVFVDADQLRFGSQCQFLEQISIHHRDGLTARLSASLGIAIGGIREVIEVQVLCRKQSESLNEF